MVTLLIYVGPQQWKPALKTKVNNCYFMEYEIIFATLIKLPYKGSWKGEKKEDDKEEEERYFYKISL